MAKKSLSRDAKGQAAVGMSFEFGGQTYFDNYTNLAIQDGDEVNPERLRVLLSQVPGRYSYWGGVLAEISQTLRQTQDAFDMWIAAKYAEQKKEKGDQKYVSEKSKMYELMVTYPKAYAEKTNEIRALETAKEKAEVLVKSYDMQSRTLQSVASLVRAELGIMGQA